MTLLAALASLKPKLERHNRSASLKDRIISLNDVNDRHLKPHLERYKKLRKRLYALQANNLAGEAIESRFATAPASALEPIAKAHALHPDSIAEQLPKLWEDLGKAEQPLTQHVVKRYDQAVKQYKGEPTPLFYDLLTDAPKFPTMALKRVKAIDSELNRLLPGEPPTESQTLKKACELSEERSAKLTELEAAVPEEVRSLLVKIKANEATLANLNLKQLEWLQENRLAGGFRITLVEYRRNQ